MCGIVGIHGRQDDRWIEYMNGVQTHRGPDDFGIFRNLPANLSLGMRRLSILDIEGGHQPMTIANGKFTIIFNGEIYNAPELRKELVEKGAQFVTDHSDTEVLLHLYALEGVNMLQKLNGMFAFVIYDRDKKLLFGARDHAGIKPLNYFYQNGYFAFASELKSLLALPCIKRELDMQSLFNYMSLMYVPGENTIIKGVKRLLAGHYFLYNISDKSLHIERFWEPKFAIKSRLSEKEWTARIREVFDAAVKRWMLSDVSVGCSLSGGLDSSAIVGSLSKAGQKVKTYSLGFSGDGEKYWNELPRAAAVAKKWGTDHHELVMDPQSLLDDLISMVWHLDEPYGGGLPSWTVFKFMSKEVKVGLSGTGGDELFGNYGKWKPLESNFLFKFFVQGRGVDNKYFERKFFEKYYYFTDAAKRESLNFAEKLTNTAELLFDYYSACQSENPRDKAAYTDIGTQLPEEFLMMTDRFSMAHSLEARTPFLDKELMELVLGIPAKMRTKPGDLKYLLRKSVGDLLPREILHARKKGFVIPIKLWLRGPLRKLAEHLLSPQRLEAQGIFKPEFYGKFVFPHLDGKADNTNKVWAALMFQLWHHVFMEGQTIDKPSYNWKAILE